MISAELNQGNPCYWNASGDFDCRGRLADSYQTPSITTPIGVNYPQIPYQDLTQNYVNNPYNFNQIISQIRQHGGQAPLNRELEVSVYSSDQSQMQTYGGGDSCSLQSPDAMQMYSGHPQLQHQQQSKPQLQWSTFNTYSAQAGHSEASKYFFQLPSQKYQDLVAEFGEPTVVNYSAGGMAIWTAQKLKLNSSYHFIKRIELIDEQIYNSFPQPHIGFMLVTVSLPIPMSQLGNVLSMSGDIKYDPVTQELTVRAMSLNYALACMALIALYTTNEISWYSLQGDNLLRKYLSYQRLIDSKFQQRNLQAILNAQNYK
jgi:hypothetical protein